MQNLVRGLSSLPKEILSEVASLLSQNDTQDITTSRIQGPYTLAQIFYTFSRANFYSPELQSHPYVSEDES